MISLIIPVYKNSANIPSLLVALADLQRQLPSELEVIFVVDASPDDSYLLLEQALPTTPFASTLALLSRNFGSLAAIRAGLQLGNGEYFAVLAADLQEPPELIIQFAERMIRGTAQVVVGKRIGREDPLLSRLMSRVFWWHYRRLVQPQVPEGGVDAFGCTRRVRDQILDLCEQNSSLVGLLFWVGFEREEVEYKRRARTLGKSAWTFGKKLRYLNDSIFSFTDLPIRILTAIGVIGLFLTLAFGSVVVAARALGLIVVPGYAATVTLVMFFGALNCFGLGVIGGYVWRGFENSKARPNYIVASHRTFAGLREKPEQLLAESAVCGKLGAGPVNESATTLQLKFVGYDRRFLHASRRWLRDPEIAALTLTPAFSDEDQERWYASLPSKADYSVWGVELEGEPVGVVGLKNIEAERSEYFGYLGEKPLWGQGHGKALLLFAMNEAKGRGCARVYLRVSRKNERAVRLYRRHNFSVVRETEEELTMERDV